MIKPEYRSVVKFFVLDGFFTIRNSSKVDKSVQVKGERTYIVNSDEVYSWV